MQESERSPGGATPDTERFDGDSARRILQRAAEEQHRLDTELSEFYSLEELEEMAAEVRISPEALRVAIDADRRERRSAAERARKSQAPGERQRGWLTVLETRMPQSWSPDRRGAVMAGAGFLGLTAVLLSVWVVAPGFFWITSLSLILVSLLVLMGASPF